MDWEIRLIKLITGETLVSNIRFDKLKKHAVLKEPLAFNFINKSGGSASVLTTRWLETDDKWDDLAEYMDTLKELENKDPIIH